MNPKLILDFIWIPEPLGGHSANPYVSMRLTIRWQRYIDAYLQCARDIECSSLNFDPKTLQGTAVFFFTSDEPVSSGWLRNGELVELLNGFRVLAVGRITNQQT